MADDATTMNTADGTPQAGDQPAAQTTAQEGTPNPTGTEPDAQPIGMAQPSSDSIITEDSDLEAAAKQSEQNAQQSEAPETYEPFKDPEGNDYAPERLGDFITAAKAAGLSQEKAQSLFSSMVPTARKYMMDDLRKSVAQWKVDSLHDSEFGGANFEANKGVAAMAYKQYATKGLRDVLNASGLGNHPEVIRLFYRVGKTMQQDKGVFGGASTANGRTPRYPNSNMVVDE